MSPPIRDGSGDSIGSIRLGDGSEISEVRTGAGDVVFSASPSIPDSADLYARFDATQLSASSGSNISTWSDKTGNGRDLTAGTPPSYNASWTNGLPAVRFERTNFEFLSVDWTDLSQPLSVFFVFQQVSVDTFDYHFDGFSADNISLQNNASGQYRVFAGSVVDTGSTDTNNHIATIIFDGSSSDFRIDGSSVFTNSNTGTNVMDGLTIGAAGSGSKQPADLNVGEVLVYQNDKTSIVEDVESVLSTKWGITV